MRVFKNLLRVTELTAGISGRLHLVNDQLIDNAAELSEAAEGSFCFYENEKYLHQLNNLHPGLIVVPNNFDIQILPGSNLFFTDKPYLTFNSIIFKWLQSEKDYDEQLGASSSESGWDNEIDESVIVKDNVVIGRKVNIGKNTIIEANTVIGNNVCIGENCHIYPNVTIYADTIIRNRVIIHSGCVIGADGFGYIFSDNEQHKIHHIGKVFIDDDVEIGANTTIDRSTIGATTIGKGTKIDNLVQIGHNCKVGSHSIICAQVGLAGNTEIGNYVYLAGQVGAAGHLKIGDGAMVGAQSGVAGNIPAGEKYLGTPAMEAGLQKRVMVSLKRLPEILKYYNKVKDV